MGHKSAVKGSPAVWISISLVTIVFGLMGAVRDYAVQAQEARPQYQLVKDWVKLPPGREFGGVSGIAFEANGLMHVFRRGPACGGFTRGCKKGDIWTFDPSGKFVRAWGLGIARRTHFIRVDRFGFIWTSDSDGHTVKKSRPDGTLVMTLGKYDELGDGPDTFNEPTDALVVPNGDIFVTDGYGNSRVVKFNKDGKFIKTWGTKGKGPGQFDLPHNIVMDSLGRLIVGDRNNKRIQVFDTEGKYITEWSHLGSPYGLDIGKDDRLYISDMDNKKVVVANARDGSLLSTIEGESHHGIAVDSAGNIYVTSGMRKFAKTAK